MPKEFFTSDEHWWHENIIKYCSRPYRNSKEMHKDFIARHNSVVGVDDVVWHLGDLSMLGANKANHIEKIFNRLNGSHHLVLGNHDDLKPFSYIKMGFVSVHTAMWFDRAGYTFVLAHDPSVYTIVENMGPKTFMLCGHIHGLFKHLFPKKRVINVGVDVWDYAPVSIERLLKLIREEGGLSE